MSEAIKKTKNLKRIDIDVDALEMNEYNPNSMSDAEFNMLCDNINEVGITDPLLVRDIGEGKYRVIGGHHRLEAAKMYDFDKVPCTVIDDPDFTEDQEKFQLVRHNVIRGKMTPEKFVSLYESLGKKYQQEVLQDSFGFTDDKEFEKLLKQTEAGLPAEMKEQFKAAKAEIKTIDDLSKVLNKLFTAYGDTLPFGYMVFDFGGKDSFWVRMDSESKKAMYSLGERCGNEKRSMDSILGGIVKLIAKGKMDKAIAHIISKTKEIEIPEGFADMPTEELMKEFDDGKETS